MILTCPSCATRYLVNPAKLRPSGRMVRCARCGHNWFEEAPPPEMEEAPEQAFAPEAEPAGAPPPDSEPQQPAEEQAEAGRVEPPVRPRRSPVTPNLPALPGTRPRWMEFAGWAGLALFILAVAGGGYLFRDEITAAWPPAKRLYDSLGIEVATGAAKTELPPLEDRLHFDDLRPSQQFVDGVLTLIIEGRIENVGPITETVPPIEVVLLDDRQLDLKTWLFESPEPRLTPGQSVTFETRLENPPPEAQDIRVTFAAGNGAQ